MSKYYYAQRQNALWIISIISVLILSLHVLLSTSITSYNPADWGLLLRLPLTFWIGLILLSILLYFGRKSERKVAIIGILIFFFLFVIPVLVLENKAEWLSISYLRAEQVNYILSEQHIQFSSIDPWELINWPGFFFISAFVSAATGLSTIFLAEIFPIFVLALIGILSYAILRLRFSSVLSCLGSLWVIASFYTGQEYFSPQATVYIFFLAVLLLVGRIFFTKSRNNALTICVIILFAASVTTHLLTSFLIMAGVIAVYLAGKIFLRKVRLPSFFSVIMCVFLISVFFFYQTIIINRTFIEITNSLYRQLFGQDSHISQVAGISQSRVIGSTAYNLEIIGTYAITIIAVVIALIAFIIFFYGLLKHKEDPKLDVFWIAWIVIAGVLGLSISYGGEGIARAFMFMLLPTCYFAIKYLRKKPRLIVVAIIILVFLHFPASYASDNYIYVPSSELKGAQALAYTPSDAVIFYEYVAPLPYSINQTRHIVNIQLLLGFYSFPNSTLVDSVLSEAQFVVISSLEENAYKYFFGANVLESHNYYQNQSRLYDNGEFTIFYRSINDQ